MKTNEKDTHQRIVPALRFPEFQNCEGWICLRGGDVFKQISNKKHNADLPILAISQEFGAIPRDAIDYKVIVSESGLENYKVVEVGDFIISLRSFQGGIEYSNYKGICSPAYVILRKKLNVENQFFKHYFKSYAFIRDLNKNLEGIRDGKMVSYKQFSEILLPIPSTSNNKEQQKIADCLSSIDSLIKATEDKIALLKAHKKGLMQQLFPAEGETTPKLRFPEFQNCGSWCSYKLKDFGAFFRGLTYSTTDVSNDNKGMGVLRSTNIQDNRLILDRDIVFVNKTCSSEQQLKKGDIVICMSNGSKTLVGKNAELDQDLSYVLTIGAFCSIFRPKNSFAKYLLQTDSYTNFISLAIGGGNINNLKNSDLENFILFAPIKRAEQQKIADCLSSIDSLIKATEDKVAHLKAHKRGLIQQLFPNIDKY